MTYLARLKEKISQDAPPPGATKVSKAPFVPFVATAPTPLREIFIPNELDRLIEKVGRAYDTPLDEYQFIRETATKDIQAALQSYRLMVKELNTGRRDDALPDERHKCTECANLTRRGRCLAAQHGEIDHVSFFEPVQDVPRRCGGFKQHE